MFLCMGKEKENIMVTFMMPKTMKELIEKIVLADTHSNLSEFMRDAIRQKIQREYPQLITKLMEE